MPIIEEAKADTLSIYSMLYLIKKGVMPPEQRKSVMVAFLSYTLRASRYGVHEAHGLGGVVEFNWMMKHEAFLYDGKTGKYKIDFDKFEKAITSLAAEFLEIEATGDYDRAKKLFEDYGKIPDHLVKNIELLKDLPEDILPIYDVRM